VPSRGFLPWFPERNQLFIFHGFFQDLFGAVPVPVLDFAEIPRMALAAGEIAPGLVDGKIVLRS
jgi:hypothetical protein